MKYTGLSSKDLAKRLENSSIESILGIDKKNLDYLMKKTNMSEAGILAELNKRNITIDKINGLNADEIVKKLDMDVGNVEEWFKYMSPEDIARYKQRLNLLEGKIPEYIDGIEVIDGKVGGKIPINEYLSIRDKSIHNSYSDSMTLGKYFDDNISYIEVAKDKGSMFFDLGDDWNVIKDKYNIGDGDLFELFNKPALDDAVKNNKIIRFSHDPRLPKYSGSALDDEWSYLVEHHGFKDLKEIAGGGWIAIH